MKLNKLIDLYKYEVTQANGNVEVSSIAYDSRKVKKSALFVCVAGGNFDGHNFINEAIGNGATVIVIEKDVEIMNSGVTVIKVKNAKHFLSYVSNVFYGRPSEKVNVIGITGTNGKTSISYLVSEIFQQVKRNVGVVGTIGITVNNQPLKLEKTTPTTPDSLELQQIIKEMVDRKVDDIVMEVTSIAIDQYRVNDCNIDIGVFTNLTEDHLDYHGDMETYQSAKGKLFEQCRIGIINIDDNAGKEYAKKMEMRGKPVVTFGIDNDAKIKARNIKLSPSGTEFDLVIDNKVYFAKTNLPGKFNVYNLLATIGVALEMNIPIESIVEKLIDIQTAQGRFESVESSKGYSVVVDYAHSPDALENVLKTAKEFNPRKIITVFGCGGDRDKTKRAIMGRISGEISDYTIITSDNPRSEEPVEIINDIEKGIFNLKAKYEKIEDREQAIKRAIEIAEKNDIVLIAGKGHETYQIMKDRTIHFDDLEIVKELISR